MRLTVNFVLNELKKVGYRIVNNQALILCPFHSDHSPSCRVSLGGKIVVGGFHCFSCKSSGGWNALAQRLGLRTVEQLKLDIEDRDYFFINKQKVEIYNPVDPDTLTLLPIKEKWRNYSPKFLRKFEAQRMWEDKLKDYYLFFPVNFIGDYKGYIRAKMHEESVGIKYWFNMEEKVFFPFDFIMQYNTPTIVLVEGIADALRLIKYGIPALAILGISITIFGYDLLDTLSIKSVILCLDGDINAVDAVVGKNKLGLAKELSKRGYQVRVFFPPPGKDPDDMKLRYLKVIKNLIKQTGGKLLP